MAPKRHNKAAAKAFCRKAFLSAQKPLRVGIDKRRSNKAALDSLSQPAWLTVGDDEGVVFDISCMLHLKKFTSLWDECEH